MAAKKYGQDIIIDPTLNKGTAFSETERAELGLIGLYPDVEETIEQQRQRCLLQVNSKKTQLDAYIFLTNLLDHNETLFYNLVMSDPPRFLPILYTPTVGEACQEFNHIYRQPRGMYISMKRKGKIRETLRNWPEQDIRVICVTDGGRILGLGDLGANGMGIPIGKLQLYTACAGVPPKHLLPVLLDAGTNNEKLLNDPLYLGLRQRRCSTAELYELTDEFIEAVQEVFPDCCVQFEDWAGPDAVALLARYRDKVSMYNDDIQGTAAVMITAMTNACRIKGTQIKDESFLFLGAGSAAAGLSGMLCEAMVADSLSLKDARQRIRMFDVNGLIEHSRTDLLDYQRAYAHNDQPIAAGRLLDAVKLFRPTVLIGLSTSSGAFTEEIIRTMAAINERPIIFPMSNPTSRAECTAEAAYTFTEGRVIFGAGVQFAPVTVGGKTYIPGQSNNFYIFPAVGLAIYATKTTRVTDEMFIACAKAVANMVSQESLDNGLIFPAQANMLEIEIVAAVKVAEWVFDNDLARVERPADIESWIRSQVYSPQY